MQIYFSVTLSIKEHTFWNISQKHMSDPFATTHHVVKTRKTISKTTYFEQVKKFSAGNH